MSALPEERHGSTSAVRMAFSPMRTECPADSALEHSGLLRAEMAKGGHVTGIGEVLSAPIAITKSR